MEKALPLLRHEVATQASQHNRQGDGHATSLCDDGSNSPVCVDIASLYSELVDLAKTNQKIQGWPLEVVDANVVVYKLKWKMLCLGLIRLL